MMKTANIATPTSNISWADVYFTAEAQREPFADANIITLKSYLTEKAYEIAIQENGFINTPSLFPRVCELFNQGTMSEAEHVEISREGIRIVINSETVDDEDAIWHALDLLADAMDHLGSSPGIVRFGSPVRYKAADISWLNLH
jgi:hypothetical protein